MTDKEALCHKIRERAERLREASFDQRFPPSMRGMCAICTIALAEAFEERGWKCRAFYGIFFLPGDTQGRKHCWLEDADLIYDLTATQFGPEFPPVYIVPADDKRYAVREWQVELKGDYWKYAPQHQRPTEEWVAMLTREDSEHERGRSGQAREDGAGGVARRDPRHGGGG